MKLFRKFNNFKNCGYYLFIDFTSSARTWMVGGEKNKRIYHYNNGVLVNVETYNPVKMNYYAKDGIAIIDKTEGRDIPKDAIELPVQEQVMGMIELQRRFAGH